MIKILFCKIYDEKYPQEAPNFYVKYGEKYEDVFSRVSVIFDSVKDRLSVDEIFDSADGLILDKKSLC